MNARTLLSLAGALEAVTGLVLLVVPALLVELLLGVAPVEPVALTVSRVAGAALLAIGGACLLSRDERRPRPLLVALTLYNALVTAVFIYAFAVQDLSGLLFWPAVLAHLALAAWCVLCLSKRSPE